MISTQAGSLDGSSQVGEQFAQTVERVLGFSLLKTDYVAWLSGALKPFGFNADNTIACVSVCRDELCTPFINAIHSAWGEAFNLSSLAGVPLLGITGFEAALSHAPSYDGLERYVLVGMTHVGTDNGVDLGTVTRAGQPSATAACGALEKLRTEISLGYSEQPEFDELDLHDVEMSLLRRRLGHIGRGKRVPSLAELTQAATIVIGEELEFLVDRCVRKRPADFAVATGILVHTSEGPSRVVPHHAYAEVRGERLLLDPRR